MSSAVDLELKMILRWILTFLAWTFPQNWNLDLSVEDIFSISLKSSSSIYFDEKKPLHCTGIEDAEGEPKMRRERTDILICLEYPMRWFIQYAFNFQFVFSYNAKPSLNKNPLT